MNNVIDRRNLIVGAGALVVSGLQTGLLFAEGHTVHEVMMYNKDPADSKRKMVFTPDILEVNAGDVVRFVSAQKGHNSASIKGMLPDGAEKWKGKINKEIEVKFSVPGFYGYQCTPHASSGMVGLIIVQGEGKLNNLEAARSVKHRGKAKKVFKGLWEEADKMGLTS